MGYPFTRCTEHLRPQPRQRLFFFELNLESQHAFFRSAPDRKHTMGWNLTRGLAVLRIHFELAFWIFRSFDRAALDHSVGHHQTADRLPKSCVLAHPLRDNVSGSFERFLSRGHSQSFVYERVGELPERHTARLLVPQKLRQWFEALLAGDRCLRTPFRSVWEVQVFQFGLFKRGLYPRLQFRRQLALFRDRLQHGLASIFEFPEVFQFLLDIANLHLVEIAGDFLAVTSDEWHGCSFIQQA